MKQASTIRGMRIRPTALVVGGAAALVLGACQSARTASPASSAASPTSSTTSPTASTTSPTPSAASHVVKISLREVGIYVKEGPDPNGPPSLSREAGMFTGTLGSGANQTDVRVIAGTGTREFFTRDGSIFGSLVFTGERKPRGDTIVGTLTITGGSGKYAGAHGTLHINGFHYDKEGYSTEDLDGTLTY